MAIEFATALIYFLGIMQFTKGQLQYVVKNDLDQKQTTEDVGRLCAAQMETFVNALSNLDLWAITILDASSKLPTGILTGNINDLGNFDQCINLEHQDGNITIRGKHCKAALNIPLEALLQTSTLKIPREDEIRGITLSLSLCIPDACKPTDVASYLNIDGAIYNDGHCQTNEAPSLDGGDIATVVFLAIILFLMVTSTTYDVYLYKTNKRPFHLMFVAFSIFTNGKKIVAVNTDDKNQLSCLHGLRCISMVWVVAGHRFIAYFSLPSLNVVDILTWPSYLYTQYIQSAPIAVDTFFFLSGMMISYGYFKQKNKPEGVSFVPLYYLHRYLRITPAAGVLYLVSITIWRHIGSGPLWMEMGQHMRTPCLKWWWSYFLYIQNYVNHNDMCIPSTWYLSVDMQLFLLSPFIFLPLGYIMAKTSMKIVYGCSASLILIFMIIQAVIRSTVDFENTSSTHERLSVWMVGFTAGIFLQEIKSKNTQVNINAILNLVIWVLVLTGMIAILLTMHDVNQNPDELKTNMFDTFHRPAWALGLSWITFSCTIGYGGFVNWFLSLPLFQVLSRLTYCMYLVHILALSFYTGQTRTVVYFTEFNGFYTFCGDIICTVILASVWVLAFESPMITIEKCIFGRSGGAKGDKSNDKGDLKENPTA